MVDLLKSLGVSSDLSILVHEYEDFDNTETSKEIKKEIVERWEKVGFLNGLDGEDKERTAIAYEQIAAYFLQHEDEYGESLLARLAFPVVRRVICGDLINGESYVPKENFSIKKFIKVMTDTDKYHTNCSEWADKLNEFRSMPEFDSEAEAGLIICEAIIEWMNGGDPDFNKIIENKFEEFKRKWVN